jgi:hypothetical protein
MRQVKMLVFRVLKFQMHIKPYRQQKRLLLQQRAPQEKIFLMAAIKAVKAERVAAVAINLKNQPKLKP